jgi:hypothetical protein
MISDIKSIPGYESLTSEQIAVTLQSSGVTHRPIDRAELMHVLNMRGMLRKIVSNNDNEKWTGTVLAMQEAIVASGNAGFIDGIRLWFSHVTNVSNVKWDTSLSEFAAPYWAMAQAFGGVEGMPTVADFAFIASLGGGWKYADIATEQVEAALAEDQRQSAIAAIDAARVMAENEFINAAAVATDRTRESLAAAYRAAADAIEAV